MATASREDVELAFRVDGIGISNDSLSNMVTMETSPLLQNLLQLNQHLEKQIETLRLRADFENKRNEKSKLELEQVKDTEIKEHDERLQLLKSELQTKDSQLENLVSENNSKECEILNLHEEISHLKEEAKNAKQFVKKLQQELSSMTEEGSHKEKQTEVKALRNELDNLLKNLEIMEKEINKCREAISKQRNIIKSHADDKTIFKFKFKEELNKVTHTMRLEIEKMREVMKNQYEEMRLIREQNENMKIDIKNIKEMLVSSSLPEIPIAHASYVHSSFAMVPHLPVLRKDTKRVVPGKKKYRN